MRRCNNFIDSFLEWQDNNEASQVYLKWVAVSILSAAMKRKLWLMWDRPLYSNFYIVLVGPPGARKGTAMRPGGQLLQAVNISRGPDSVTRQALIKAFQTAQVSDKDENSDLITHSSVNIFSEEMTVFTGYRQPDFFVALTDWFDCADYYEYSTKGGGEEVIYGTWLNLIGATTPVSLASSITGDSLGGGLLSRMIFVYADRKRKKVALPYHTTESEELFKNLKHDLNKVKTLVGQYKVTEAFEQAYRNWYEGLDEQQIFNNDERFAGYVNRRPTHVKKLAMVLAAARHDRLVIDEQDFVLALDMLHDIENKMPLALGGIGDNELAWIAANIDGMLVQAPEGKLMLSQIMTALYYSADGDKIVNCLRQMSQMQQVRLLRYEEDGKRDTIVERLS